MGAIEINSKPVEFDPFKKETKMVNIILILIIVVLLSERLAKFIPDSETGFIGFVRKALKTIALYTENIR